MGGGAGTVGSRFLVGVMAFSGLLCSLTIFGAAFNG